MYKSIGYRTKSQAAVLIPAATELLRQFGNKTETVLADCYRVFSDRRFVKSTSQHDFLQFSKVSEFSDVTGSALKNLLHINHAVLANCGFGDFRPAVLEYKTDALMTLDEVITEVLNSHIHLPTAEEMDGEKTSFEMFRTHIPQVIRELAILERLRPWYVTHFRRYIGDLLYRLDVGETQASALDQFDLTLLTVYANPKMVYGRSSTDGNAPYRPVLARDTDPETAEVIGRIKSVVEPGPWIRFNRLLSNADRNELIYQLGPVVNQLPLITGYRMARGPFYEQYYNVVESLAWGDTEAFKATLQRVQYLDSADPTLNMTGVRVPTKKILFAKNAPPLTPVLLDYKPSINVQIYRDQNNVEIAHEWRSSIHRRLVSTRFGASEDTMLQDMASKVTSMGEVAHQHLNIDSFGLVDLDSSVEARMTDSGQQEKNTIVERIWYVQNGRMAEKEVDMTLFYNRIGNMSYRPAFAEFFMPTLEWFRMPDSAAIDYIIGKLELTPYNAARSKEAIIVSHNVARFMRVTGKPEKDVRRIINVGEYCRFVSGIIKS